MSRPTIAYNSKYGSTRRYALALSERLGTPAVELSSFEAASTADPLIVLAPIYATRIRGRKRLLRAIRSAPGRVALVVVGLSPPTTRGAAPSPPSSPPPAAAPSPRSTCAATSTRHACPSRTA
ncbi:flavodoxin domain-containing protein [Dietzia aerolata]|uniref:flavodoxin domain-containing protein n=1 Tax=Dietzia aerolata TaxID=595984 RepID=UPI00363810B8